MESKGCEGRSCSSYCTAPGSCDMSVKSEPRDDRWNPRWIAAKIFGVCFGRPDDEASASPRGVEEFPNNYSFPSASSNSSMSSERRTNDKILPRHSSTHAQPGGMTFTFSEVAKSTRNFCDSHMIGQGAFGAVYKGILEDGNIVAIKRGYKDNKSLDMSFLNEISTLAHIEHLNLVKLLGYLEHKDERLIIVEYVSNGTLREHLDCLRGNPLDFSARLDIAIDVAHAITYLHMYTDHPIIHRDIKSSNILLTENLRAKVGDFGLARLGSTDDGLAHVVTEVKGTVGYLDPEYLITNQLTVRSDVYSFGVLLVELVSGRLPIEEKRASKDRQTSSWAMRKHAEGNHKVVLDPKIPLTEATEIALEKVLKVASKCLSPNKRHRPDMKSCVEILWGIRKDYRALLSSVSPSASISSSR